MAKRKRARSRKNIKLRDEINRLPDELLVSILSRLSLKEAAASSILCRRWRYLWTFTSKLDFDSPGRSYNSYYSDLHLPFRLPAIIPESWEYVGWVDTVLGLLHDGSGSAAIEEFIISFGLSSAHKDHIDRWLKFALGRKVERLELNLRPTYTFDSYKRYTFPLHLLCNQPDSHSWGFKHLRQICMSYVVVSDETLEIFLRSCPLLGELSLDWCRGLSRIKIIGPIPAFKRLKIIYCQDLESVEIRDSNLVSLFYTGKKLEHFVLKNVPLLVEMGVGGMIDVNNEDFHSMFSSYLPQLEKLNLNKDKKLSFRVRGYVAASCVYLLVFGVVIKIVFVTQEARCFWSGVKISNLKQLVWKFVGSYSYGYGESLMPLTVMIGALPLLQRLVFMTYDDVEDPADSEIVISPPQVQEDEIIYSRDLRQVEFAGYHGVAMEFELLAHILEKAAAVEELIIRPPKGDYIPAPPPALLCNRRPYTKQEADAFRLRAKAQLTTIMPPTVNLSIL